MMMTPNILLMVVVTLITMSLASLVDCTGQTVYIPKDYPGRSAYTKLGKYLLEVSKTNDVGTNLKTITDLLYQLQDDQSLSVRPKKFIDAIQSIVSLDRAANEKLKCTQDTNKLIKFTIRGTLAEQQSDKETQKQQQLDEATNQQLSAIVAQSIPKVLANCETDIGQRLEEAIESVSGEVRDRVNTFLSHELIEKFSASSYSAKFKFGPHLGRLTGQQDDTAKTFHHFPHKLVLAQLFEVSRGDNHTKKAPVKQFQLYEDDSEEKLVEWPKIGINRFRPLVEKYIMEPCQKYSSETYKVMDIYYLAKRHLNETIYDYDQFMSNQKLEFKYHLFRHEFCHRYGKLLMWALLWDPYRVIMFPNMRFGNFVITPGLNFTKNPEDSEDANTKT